MRRSLHLGTLVLACAALAPACLLNAGPIEGTTGGAGGGAGGTAGSTTGGTGGTMAICGNGALEGSEQCDDGALLPGDGCDAGCTIEAGWACGGEPSKCAKTCGDAMLQSGEECDDMNIANGDGCSQGCKIEAGWECDSGTLPSTCHPSCGDGTLDDGEGCDVGPDVMDDGCAADCQAEVGWDCTQPGGADQPSECVTTCGDGIIAQGVEICDDADMDDTNGCKADCTAVNPGWTCHPMNGGATSCNTICGDGVGVGAEECDDGGTVDSDGCSATCTVEHECGNGVVDPTEGCDGGPGCTACMLDAATVCADAKVIAPDPMGIDPTTGVRVSHFEGDSAAAGATVAKDALPAPCGGFEHPVLHSYTTGKNPSIVTVEALPMLEAGTATFDKTRLWIYRDCPNEKEVEDCDTTDSYASVTTGFIPAQTTLFIVFAGKGMMEKGPYRLEITEQPVKLFFHESFGPETMVNEYPLPQSLTQTLVGDGGWKTCVPGAGSPCPTSAFNLDGHSRGALGRATSGSATQTVATIATPTLNLSGLNVAVAQVEYDYNHGGGSGFGSVTPMDGNVAGTGLTFNTAAEGRATLAMPKSMNARLDFVYDDGASLSMNSFYIDDIYIYGY